MSEERWHRLVELASADDDVVGLVLTGGRGKGVASERSDWDGLLVVTDTTVSRWRGFDFGDLDMSVLGESEFADYAEPSSAFSWRRYDFAYLTPVIDRRGFGTLLQQKGQLAPDQAPLVAEEHLDAALNSLYRAAKNDRDGDETATLLDLAEMIGYYLTAAFALECRLRPYNKLLRWDLDRAPLGRLLLSPERLLVLVSQTAQGQLGAAWTLADRLADAFRDAGATEVLYSWEDHLVAVRPRRNTASSPS